MLDADTTRSKPKVNSKMVRQFSIALLLLTSVLVANANLAKFSKSWFSSFLVILVVSAGIVGLLFPNRLRLVLTVVIGLTHPIGSIISFVVLGVFFYLVFTPFALVMRLFGRDTLDLRHREEQSTYWKESGEKISKASYFRQS